MEEPISKEEVRRERFRVVCLHPVLDIESGAIELQSRMNRLCGHGTGMTVEEMNKNLIWKGKPYIRIPYCKYCYRENTVGVFDDTPQLIGWAVLSPTEDDPYFRLSKLTKEAYRRALENFRKYGRV